MYLVPALIALTAACQAVQVASDENPPARFERLPLVPTISAESLVASGRYVRVEKSQFDALQAQSEEIGNASQLIIRKSEYSAELRDGELVSGSLQLECVAPGNPGTAAFWSLGRTNLQNLNLTSGTTPIPRMTLPSGDVAIPRFSKVGTLQGTWQMASRAAGSAVQFDLLLLESPLVVLKIRTGSETRITATDAVVVPETNGAGFTEWTIYPRSSKHMTITCVPAQDAMTQYPSDAASMNSEFLFVEQLQLVQWSLSLPERLHDEHLKLTFSAPCEVTHVALDEFATLPWTQQAESVSIQLPRRSGYRRLTILGSAPIQDDGRAVLPLLLADPTHAASGFHIDSSTIRLRVPIDRAIRQLHLAGIRENDVSYTNDGYLVAQLEQYSNVASATLKLAEVIPDIHEHVVFRMIDAVGQTSDAEAFIEVRTNSGIVSELQWTIPAPWRVTDVREMGTDLPLFFQRPGSDDKHVIHLRSPLRGTATTRLKVLLRSTRSTRSTDTPPRLVNAAHRRIKTVYVMGTRKPPHSLVDASPDTLQEYPWIPESVRLVSAGVFVPDDTAIDSPTDVATIESPLSVGLRYTISVTNQLVTEQTQLRFQSDESLPENIEFRTAPEVILQVSSQSATVAELRPADLTGPWRRWFLLLPPGSDSAADVLVYSQRPAAAQLPAAQLVFPAATAVTGTYRNVSGPDYAVTMSSGMSDDETTAKMTAATALRYENTEEPRILNVQRVMEEVRPVRVCGRIFTLLSRTLRGFDTENLADLTVASGNASSMIVQIPDAEQITVLVDNRRVAADYAGELLTIQLPTESSGLPVQIRWNSLQNPTGLLATRVRLPVPVIRESDTDGLQHQIQSTDDSIVTQFGDSVTFLELQPTADSGPRLLSNRPEEVDVEALETLRRFESRWQAAMHPGATGITVALKPASTFVDCDVCSRRQLTGLGLSGFFAALFLAALLRRNGRTRLKHLIILLLLSLVPLSLLSGPMHIAAQYLTVGFSVLTLVAAVRRILMRPLHHLRSRREANDVTTVFKTACLIVGISVGGMAMAQPQELPPIEAPVFVTDDSSSTRWVYAQPEFLNRLQEQARQQPANPAMMLASQVDVAVESDQSALIRIEMELAVSLLRPTEFVIPLNQATLVQCTIDDRRALPGMNTDSQPVLLIEPEIAVIPRALQTSTPNDLLQKSREARIGDDWTTRKVSYVLRSQVHTSGTELKVDLPLPHCPQTDIRVTVFDKPVSMSLMNVKASATATAEGPFQFPRIYNMAGLELRIQTQESIEEAVDNLRSVNLVCIADVSPAKTVLDCRYTMTSISELPELLRLNIPAGFKLNRLQFSDGTTPEFFQLKTEVMFSRGDQRTNEVDLTMILESSRQSGDMNKVIPTEQLISVPEFTMSGFLLVLRTSAPFTVTNVHTGKAAATEYLPSTGERQRYGLRESDRTFRIDSVTSDATVEIEPQPLVRTAKLSQTVEVTGDEIQWSCVCDIDVSGQAIFRQRLQLSPDLTLESVRVAAGELNRLQSWSQLDGELFVALREATKGPFQVTVSATLPFRRQQAVALPVVTIPESGIEQSTLMISAEEEAHVQIVDLSGGIPETPFDIETDVVSSTPLKIVMADNANPIVIQSAASETLRASVYAVLTDPEQQTGVVAVVMDGGTSKPVSVSFSPADSPESRRFVLRNMQPVPFTVSADGLQVPGDPDQSPLTYIVTDVSFTSTADGTMEMLLPGFLDGVEYVSAEAIAPWELARPDATAEIPEPLLAALAACQLTVNTTEFRRLPGTIDDDRQALRCQLVVAPPSPGKQDDGALSLAAITQTHLTITSGTGVGGVTELVLFSGDTSAEPVIFVPDKLNVYQVTIDGQQIPGIVDRDRISIQSRKKLTVIQLHWMTESPQISWLPSRFEIPLPRLLVGDNHGIVYLETSEADDVQIHRTGGALSSAAQAEFLNHWVADAADVANLPPGEEESAVNPTITGRLNAVNAGRLMRSSEVAVRVLSGDPRLVKKLRSAFALNEYRTVTVSARRMPGMMLLFPVAALTATLLAGIRVKKKRNAASEVSASTAVMDV